MGKFKRFVLKVIIITFMPFYYLLTAISPKLKAAGLSGKSFKLRDRGNYEGSIALSNEIIGMASRPHRRLNDASTLYIAYANLFHCYWAIEDYESSVDNGIKAINLLYKIYGDKLDLSGKLGGYFSNFARCLQEAVEHTNRELEQDIRQKLDSMIMQIEEYELASKEGSLP